MLTKAVTHSATILIHSDSNGKMHNKDGPAFIYILENGSKEESYFIDGKRHRLDGPAMICIMPGGAKIERFFINDSEYSEKEFNSVKENFLNFF